MAKYKAYPEYKDSGVEWLGEVPNHWKTISISRLFSRVKRTGYTEKELLSVYRDYGVIPKSSRDDNNNKPSEDLSPYQLVQPNDLVMNKMKAWQGSIAISEYEGIVSPAYFVYQPNNSLFELAHPKYVHYLLRNPIYVTQYLSRSKGIRVNQWDLDPDEFRNIEILLPSKVEQEKIYSFLDHETAKIDNLIEKQQQLIELLKEKRQAVISLAVTKGLNPDVPMKDSGVEWLGDVPEHWGITKLKWVGRTTSGGTPTTSKFEIYYEDGHIPWIRTTDLNNGELFDTPIRITSKAVNDTACSILPVGSVLLGMYGGAGSIGKHAILRFESTINQAVCGVLPCGRILPDFLHKYYEFYRPFWMIDAAGTRKDPNIGQDNIKEGIILIPPFEEQVEINNHIDNMRNIYECIIENALEGMDLLQERRTALISAAVTGKIDVRDWVAPETQDVEEPQEVTA
ncbi:restriction endonuclease subunit S [Enterobacter asburiae]|uniref:restriction endonuclease subunit S n=1 Tax=Enterobacter asburiae TaxID=61645 RepID=UPI002003FC66|nr:restriction endonuclease subunit S [Enterobacter asburiae]MCK6995974.1 restriction endonuclease subunit S [Enterobacter asburiae]MCK7246216.1 restriction endonuclease subunit S [Enterobacter asburiae]MCK7298905.1 restriction endonuclease subunit S [Enterobacter asburiae]